MLVRPLRQASLQKVTSARSTQKPLATTSDQQVKTQPDEKTLPLTNLMVNSQIQESRILTERLMWIDQLRDSFKDSSSLEIRKVLQSLQEISRTLQSASRNEIDLNQTRKLLEQASMDQIMQRQTIGKLKETQQMFRVNNEDCVKKLALSIQDQNRLERAMHQQKRLNEEQFKKIKYLEKRIEMMLENNLQTHQDQLRGTLTELVKENEQLKRDLVKREKENDRLKELNSKLLSANARLTKKLEALKTRKIGSNEIVQQINYSFDPTQLPQNLEFRLSNLQNEQVELLLDLGEHGSEAFTNTILMSEQKKELTQLISSQLIREKDFSEKLNQILNEFVIMMSYQSIDHFQTHISSAFKSIFQSEVIHLWIIDGMTGRAYRIKKTAIMTEGAFFDVIMTGEFSKPIQGHALLYQTTSCNIFGTNVLLLPLMGSSKKPCGILEIQNVNGEFLDLQYYGLLINLLSKNIIQQILDYEAVVKEIRYRDLYYNGFLQIIKSRSKKEFNAAVQFSAQQIFHIVQSKILYVENDSFELDGSNYQLTAGCAGLVYGTKKAMILSEITRNAYYDEYVDISTILPVFIGPIVVDNKVVAILEFLLKKKSITDHHQFGNLANIGFKTDSIDKDAQKFYEIVSQAYQLVFLR